MINDSNNGKSSIKPDTTAPTAPVVDPINGRDPITGTAEAGSTIIVKGSDGKVLDCNDLDRCE